MKKSILFILVIALASCEVIIVEPFDARDSITGSYNLIEYSETYYVETSFPVSIQKWGTDGETIRINNFYDVGISVRAYLRGDRISIPFQVVDGYEVSGSGWIDRNEIEFSYSVFDQYTGGFTDHCYATAW